MSFLSLTIKVIKEAGIKDKPIENIKAETMPSAVPLRLFTFFVNLRG